MAKTKSKPARKKPIRPVAKKAAKVRAPKSSAPQVAKSAALPAKAALAGVIRGAARIQFTANSRALLVARTKKKAVTLFDLEAGIETPALPTLPTVSAVALSADSRHFAMGTTTGILAVASTQTGKVLWKSKALGKEHPVGDLLFSLDGTLLFAVSPPPEEWIAENAEPDKETDRWIRVMGATSGNQEAAFTPVSGAICSHMALSPDGQFLAHSELQSNSVLIWHLPTRQMGACIRLPRNRGAVKGLAFGLTVRHLFIAQQTQTTCWNAENGTELSAVETPGMRSLAVVDHGDTLAVLRLVDEQPLLELLKADTGFVRKSVRLPVKMPARLAGSPDGTLLALASAGDCYVWHVAKLLG